MEPVVRVTDLVQKIGKRIILDGVNLEVYKGECFGLFGLRGAGKTALLHILAGIDRFRSGRVEVLGYDARKSERFKHRLGLVTQEKSLFQDLRAAENLDFLTALKNASRENCYRVIERFQLTDYLKLPVTALEAGVYQRLALACALLNEPELLLGDDLFQSIDPASRHIILRELREYLACGGTCILSFNNMDAYSKTDLYSIISRVGWLEQGRLTVYQPGEAREQWEDRLKSFAEQSGELHA